MDLIHNLNQIIKKDLFAKICTLLCSLQHYSRGQDPEITQVSFHGGLREGDVAHTHDGAPLSHQKR